MFCSFQLQLPFSPLLDCLLTGHTVSRYCRRHQTSASEDAGPEEGWIVGSHISWIGKRSILYKGVESSP